MVASNNGRQPQPVGLKPSDEEYELVIPALSIDQAAELIESLNAAGYACELHYLGVYAAEK